MNPSLVLSEISSKDRISLGEAERGILACLVRAARKQADRDSSFLHDTFNGSLPEHDIERFFRSELKDLIYKHEQEEDRFNRTVLQKAIKDMNNRVSIDSWDDDVVDEHRETCEQIIDKARPTSR